MVLVIAAFVMVAAMSVFAVLKLESESRSEQFAKLSGRRNARFID